MKDGSSHYSGRFVIEEVTKVRDALKQAPRQRGAYWYMEFCHRFLRIFLIPGRDPGLCVQDAAFCIMFLGFWRRDVSLREKAGPK